ncbi:LysR family transcriptional regulator [Antarcticirhabdus aurantiaca]|uniref:LysR family transcriptional regulator n=1 Tax=Antarcticirhabdus aurantiaca TaxID=2606717 RepID=A0ACD4NU01_9HYPH|nr:LysR family transcriptional regulator [Antarcticirhabdus aurantiaca]WAJ30308.1 LysR family transcriptional regulator [Jeongeuplla avenae]
MIEKLEYFIALASERHFGRAAERLGITQPTLSAGLRHLEEQLGVTLVNRGSRFQGVTAEGERVLAWARRIVGDVRSMRDEIASGRAQLSGTLRIAVIPTALAVVSRLTTPFHDKHPDVAYDIQSMTSADIAQGVEDFEVDIGLTYIEDERVRRLDTRFLYAERYCLVTTEGNAFSERAEVSWAEVASIPLCLLSSSMQNRRILDRHLTAEGRQVRTVLESNSMVALITHVRTGRFATIMPLRTAEILRFGAPIVMVPIAGGVSYRIGLVTARRAPRPALIEAFWNEVAAVGLS